MLNKIKRVNRIGHRSKSRAAMTNALSYTVSNSKLALVDSIITYASAIAHNQRTPIATLSMICAEYAKILPLLLQIDERAKEHGIETSELIKDEQIQFLKDSQDISQKCLSELNDIIEDNLQSIKSALQISLGNPIENNFKISNIYENLNLLKANLALTSPERELLRINYSSNFKYLGNSITINQILANLLENALYQIRKNGRGEIFVSQEERAKTNILIFKDTAGGASQRVVNSMFNMYFTTKTEGNGIGLNFCKRAMQMFGGDIKTYSIEGEFMEFMLIFPKV
jgi:signal transduction histidine kinase